MAEMEAVETDVRKRGRKRLRYEHLWIRKKRKLQKDSGAAYETYKGEARPAKQPVAITCRCKLNCSQKVRPGERKRIFDEFYKLKSHDAQNNYLYGLIHKEDVRRRRVRGAGAAKRAAIYRYHVRCNYEVEVCKKTFCDIHAVGKRRVEVLCEKLKAGNLLPGDARGTHRNRRTIPEQVKERIREHIRSFPRHQSHYSRGDNRKREYLPEGLSIAQMYRLFLSAYETEAYADEPLYVVKEWLYRKIFNEEFNLSFGYPRSDTCQLCDELRMAVASTSSETQRSELNSQLAEHQLKASQAYQLLQNDTKLAKNDPDLHVITFDLQQNLPVPTLTHSSMFIFVSFGYITLVFMCVILDQQ